MKHKYSEADFAALLLALLLMSTMLLLISCGSMKVSGNTKHEVGGTATIKFDVDMSVCDALPEAERADCVKTLLDLLNKAKEKQQ